MIILLISCEKSSDVEERPKITFEKMEFYGEENNPDSAWIYFDFVDEDGDLGTDDTTANCWMRYYEIAQEDTVEFSQFIRSFSLPNLTPNAKNTFIEGNISLSIKPAPIFNVLSEDNYIWSIQIRDRAGNFSNLEWTPIYEK